MNNMRLSNNEKAKTKITTNKMTRRLLFRERRDDDKIDDFF